MKDNKADEMPAEETLSRAEEGFGQPEDTSEKAGASQSQEAAGLEEDGLKSTRDGQPEEELLKSAECASEEAAWNTQETEKKGFFGKKKEKKDPKDEKIEELTDRLRRNMAEFDNFRKRTEKEKSAMFEIGAKDIVERILPVVDSLERGLSAIPEEERDTPFADGMDKIYRQLMKTLEEAGVKPIEAVGKPFNPDFHNAVMHIENESLGENVVAQELQKGYTYREAVVRHSMVQVAN